MNSNRPVPSALSWPRRLAIGALGLVAIVLVALGGGATAAEADQQGVQDVFIPGLNPSAAEGNLADDAVDLFPNLSVDGLGSSSGDPVTWSASYYPVDRETARLEVEAEIGPSWHLYSLTQKPGGPLPTKLTIESPAGVELAGTFSPTVPPNKSTSTIFKGLTVEEHEGKVVFVAPIRTPAGFRGDIALRAEGLVCSNQDGSCLPVDQTLTATFAGDANGKAAVATDKPVEWFRDDDYSVAWRATVKPAGLSPGGRGVLEITARPDPTFHVYQSTIDDADSSTNFVVTEKSGLKVGKPVSKQKVISKAILPTLPPVSYYEGEVTWKLPIEVPQNAKAGKLKLQGMIAYQACTSNSCLQPMALEFTAEVPVTTGKISPSDSSAVKLAPAKRADALDAAATVRWADKVDAKEDAEKDEKDDQASSATSNSTMPFPTVLLLAFVGGVILNFMPCVLPVVVLKVMSFVQQAGEDRRRVLMLNIVYMAGILSVFAILAGLAVLFSFSWGQQFTYFPVRLGLTLLIFALALSYLGVWEIPVPGMAAGKGSQDLQSGEGYAGAFFKGVFATVLATPCSGPLLGAILALTITLHPIQTVIVIMTVGLGMAIPYLIIGLRPSLVSWLPKPGEWMNTLKEFLAFLFLGTVAFFFHQFSDANKLPVFVAMIGVWFGCWIIGKVPNWASIEKRVMAWTGGIASAAVIGLLAFRLLGPAELDPGEKAIQWEPYSESRLAELQQQGRTVMVDFTAKWCVNCIVNYNVALDTEPTREMLEELGAVAMLADWTDQNSRIKQKLEELESRSIPLLAIYPGRNPDEPIVLRDLVSQDAVLEALREAGSSVASASVATTPHRDLIPEVASSTR